MIDADAVVSRHFLWVVETQTVGAMHGPLRCVCLLSQRRWPVDHPKFTGRREKLTSN